MGVARWERVCGLDNRGRSREKEVEVMTAVEVGSGSMFGSRVGIDGREPLLSMLRKASCRVTSYRLSPTCHPHSRHVFSYEASQAV